MKATFEDFFCTIFFKQIYRCIWYLAGYFGEKSDMIVYHLAEMKSECYIHPVKKEDRSYFTPDILENAKSRGFVPCQYCCWIIKDNQFQVTKSKIISESSYHLCFSPKNQYDSHQTASGIIWKNNMNLWRMTYGLGYISCMCIL